MVDEVMSDSGTENARENRKKKILSGNRVVLGRFEVDLNAPLANFEHAYADAFECISHETGASDHVAIVIKGRYPARRHVLTKMFSNEISGIMTLRFVQAVEWPGDEGQRYVMIFRHPGGKPLMARNRQQQDPISEEVLRRAIMRPVFMAIRELAGHNVFHGNIRPDTIFLNNFDNAEAILGECASSIPGINQPALFETIERALADPQCKGIGNVYDDIYAFGVTVALLLRGHNHLHDKSDRQIIEEKIMHGTFVTMTEGMRLSPNMGEFLRSVLNDDSRQRWGVEQLAAWIDGNRTTPKLSSLGAKAQRAIEFNGKKYFRPRMLAKDLHENVSEAVKLIDSGLLVKWVERALSDAAMAETLAAAISHAHTGGRATGYEDRLLCYVCMSLDPNGPIRYKEIRVFPSGVGHGLAFAHLRGTNFQSYGELIRDRYIWTWLNAKDNMVENRTNLIHEFDLASKIIVRRGIDYGIERCLYDLCEDVPCLSDILQGFYVTNGLTLLQSLNAIGESRRDGKPIDRHIASFISARDNKDNSGLMMIIDGNDPMRRSLAMLNLFQLMQKRFDNPKLEHLCEWLSKDMEIVANRFHNQDLKKEIMKFLPKEIKIGNLTRILGLIDNPVQVRKDELEFVRSGHKYAVYSNERDTIRMELDLNKHFGYEAGRQIALIIALAVSGVMILSTLVMNFTGWLQ